MSKKSLQTSTKGGREVMADSIYIYFLIYLCYCNVVLQSGLPLPLRHCLMKVAISNREILPHEWYKKKRKKNQ